MNAVSVIVKELLDDLQISWAYLPSFATAALS